MYIQPLQENGQPYRGGSIVRAMIGDVKRETVVTEAGLVWLGELMPASSVSISFQGKVCEFTLPLARLQGAQSGLIKVNPNQCSNNNVTSP